MDVELKARHLELTDAVREYVDRKVGRLDRYLPDIKATRVDLGRGTTRSQGEVYTAQVTAWVGSAILRAEEMHADLFAAIDLAADKIHRQIDRYKGKRLHRRHERGELPLAPPEETEEPVAADAHATIVRRKRFEIFSMSEAEAVDQFELLGHDFFVFVNGDSGDLNVLYRRHDGQLGLIEPERA